MTSPSPGPVSVPNTPGPHPETSTPILPNPPSLPKEPDRMLVNLPIKPTPPSECKIGAPPLPPKPKAERGPLRDTSPPPPPLPPRQPPLPPRLGTTPTRGVLESRSPHMDPVEPRRENSHLFLQKTTHSPPPAVVPPRRHSQAHIVNGSQMGGKFKQNSQKIFFKRSQR